MIYFIKIKENNYVKIGYTKADPHIRINAIERTLPFEAELLLLIDGELSKERELHKKFKEYYIKNEWFKYSDEIKNFISSHVHLNIIPKKIASKTYFGDDKQQVEKIKDLYLKGFYIKDIIQQCNISMKQFMTLRKKLDLRREVIHVTSPKYDYYKGQRMRKNALRDFKKGKISQQDLQQVYIDYPVKTKRKEIAHLL